MGPLFFRTGKLANGNIFSLMLNLFHSFQQMMNILFILAMIGMNMMKYTY